MAEQKHSEAEHTAEDKQAIPVKNKGGKLSPWPDMNEFMQRTDRMFDALYPGHWRWRRWPFPFGDMGRMFEDVSPRGWLRRWEWPDWNWMAPFDEQTPRVDLIDRDDEIVIKAELPGVSKDDLDVSLTDDAVTIRATTQREQKEERGEYYRREISRGEFSRTVRLPTGVDADKAKASFKNGVMELVLPKTSPTKRRRVKVQ